MASLIFLRRMGVGGLPSLKIHARWPLARGGEHGDVQLLTVMDTQQHPGDLTAMAFVHLRDVADQNQGAQIMPRS
jgi:hypothetical protein